MLIWREEILPSLLHQSYSSFSYIIFLRITPFLPNWFINLVSPVIGVRLAPFWIGTFLGVAPPSFVAIQAGTTLQKLTSSTDAITAWSVAMIVGFAILRYENHVLLYFWLSIVRNNPPIYLSRKLFVHHIYLQHYTCFTSKKIGRQI